MNIWKPPPENLDAMNAGLAIVVRKHKVRQRVVGPLRSDCDELYAIVQGKLQLQHGRKKLFAEERSIVFRRRRQVFAIRQEPGYSGPVRIVSVLFRAPAKWRISWSGVPQRLSEVWWRRFLDLESSCDFDEHGQRVFPVKLVMGFLEVVAEHLSAGSMDKAAIRSGVAADWLQTWVLAEDFIRERAGDGLTVNELARGVSVSLTQLRRIFHATRGVSPKQALTAWRIETAEKLLASGRHNISQVARDVGYATIQRFSAAFKEHIGVPPSRYDAK